MEFLVALLNRLRNSQFSILVVIVFLLGFGLRLYQLGKASLWFDEAGVAMAATAPTLQDTLDVAREHMSAMPLDYVIARIMARISLDEGWLRLPSVIWGSLTLLVLYFLAKKMVGQRAALIAMTLLALSPIHVQYSQELRFYASGVFFYLLSTLLLWEAMSRNKIGNWIVFVLITVVGGYFYLFVPLVLCNGLAWLISKFRTNPQLRSLTKRYFISAIVVAALFLPGFLIFGVEPLSGYSPDIRQAVNALLGGLGWLPIVTVSPDFGWLWGEFLFMLGLVGTILAVRERRYSLVALSVSGALQVTAIFSVDLLNHYFIAARQILYLMPLSLLFVSLALSRWMETRKVLFKARLNPMDVDHARLVNRGLAFLLTILLMVSGVFSLKDYYNDTKSLGGEISRVLAAEWHSGDKIWVIPWYEPLLYRFYLEKRMGVTALSTSFEGKQIDALERPPAGHRTFLITPSNWPQSYFDYIEQFGFQPFRIDKKGTDAQVLWLFQVN